MKILVTGANGYIGSRVVKHLCDLNVDVIATDLDDAHVDKRAIFYKANIFDDNNWYSYFGEPDVCLHMAWRDGFIHDSEKHMLDLSNHYRFITRLMDDGLKQFATMGSMHEVGYWEGAIDENTPCDPMNQYGVAKNALRKSIMIYAEKKRCVFQWLRAFYIFGDDTFGNSIFCKIRKAVNDGAKTFPFTTGKNKYDFLHVDELASQICLCVMQKEITGIINCCSGNPVSLAEQIEWYISYNNLPIKLDYGKYPERTYDSPCIYGNPSKIEQVKALYKRIILVTGAGGQLGYDVISEISKRGLYSIGTDVLAEDDIANKAHWSEYIQLDITDQEQLERIKTIKPYAIIHCAAWTNVDGAEDEKNKPLVKKINVDGTKNLVKIAKEINCKFLYVSTDYVFNGEGERPWEPDDKNYSPLNYYGETKLQGELIVSSELEKFFIVRIAWAFGKNGKNFIKTMYNAGQKCKKVRVVNDQIGTPTYTYDLARLLIDMILTNKYGYYHATNGGGFISWYDLTCEIYKQAGMYVEVEPVSSNDYGLSLAKRPHNSRLSKTKLIDNGFKPLPDWKDALRRYLEEIKENN